MYALALVLAAGPAAPSDADRLLSEMDAAVTAARTLRIDFEIRTPPNFLRLSDRSTPAKSFNGSLVLGDRNRFRYELHGDFPGLLVSDGTRLGGTWIGMGYPPGDIPLPAWHNEVLRAWLGRGGTLLSMIGMSQVLTSRPVAGPGPGDGPRATNARLLPDEDVRGVKARVVEYDLTWVGPGLDPASGTQPTRVRVWIDPKTRLPVRRTMTPTAGRGEAADPEQQFTAIHTKFELDPKLDDKLFELPK